MKVGGKEYRSVQVRHNGVIVAKIGNIESFTKSGYDFVFEDMNGDKLCCTSMKSKVTPEPERCEKLVEKVEELIAVLCDTSPDFAREWRNSYEKSDNRRNNGR